MDRMKTKYKWNKSQPVLSYTIYLSLIKGRAIKAIGLYITGTTLRSSRASSPHYFWFWQSHFSVLLTSEVCVEPQAQHKDTEQSSHILVFYIQQVISQISVPVSWRQELNNRSIKLPTLPFLLLHDIGSLKGCRPAQGGIVHWKRSSSYQRQQTHRGINTSTHLRFHPRTLLLMIKLQICEPKDILSNFFHFLSFSIPYKAKETLPGGSTEAFGNNRAAGIYSLMLHPSCPAPSVAVCKPQASQVNLGTCSITHTHKAIFNSVVLIPSEGQKKKGDQTWGKHLCCRA